MIASRPSKTFYYLEIAKIVAMRATCLHHKYGCVIVKNDRIIATGYNGAPRGENNCCDAGFCIRDKKDMTPKYGGCVAVHAEQNALLCASQDQMIGAHLYLACSDDDDPMPCIICDRMIRNSGISKIITKAGVTDVYALL